MEIGSIEWQQLIIEGAGHLDIQLDRRHAEKFALHALELDRWNQKMNLTSIKKPLDVAVKHYLDSIIPSPLIKAGASLLDIGSGGGFPGIPLKIIMPSLTVTMIDATRKKVSFLNHVIRVLQLKGIRAVHTRLEDWIKDSGFHQTFDVITCRAFSDLKRFAGDALPLANSDGVLIALKGKEARAELKQLTTGDGGGLRLDLDNNRDSRVSLSVEVFQSKLPYLNEPRLSVVMRPMWAAGKP